MKQTTKLEALKVLNGLTKTHQIADSDANSLLGYVKEGKATEALDRTELLFSLTKSKGLLRLKDIFNADLTERKGQDNG